MKIKLARMTTASLSINVLLKGQEVYFSNKNFSVHLAGGQGSRTTASGMPIAFLPFTREFSIWQDLYALWKTWKWLRNIRPEILHTHTPKAGLIGMIAGYFAGVPIRLHTVAGLPVMELRGARRMILRCTERVTALLATRIYPNSHGLMKYMIREKLAPPRKMKVIGHGSSNGIDLSYFNPSPALRDKAKDIRRGLGIADTDFVFIFLGRLDHHKGMRELNIAFKEVRSKHKHAWLLLVGFVETARGGVHPDVLSGLRSDDHVILQGWQEDIRPWLLAAHALVFPSYREGLPGVPLQAAAMGLPVIATDIVGCNEIVFHGVNGLLVPPKNASALASAMLNFIHDGDKKHEMGTRGREIVMSKFEQQYFWRELENEYRTLLNTWCQKDVGKNIYPTTQTGL